MFSLLYTQAAALFAQANSACTNSFLGIPTWFKYLKTVPSNQCTPELRGLNDIWLIGLAVVEILTRVAVLVAIAFIVYAGIKYSNSRANAEKVNSAKFTLQDAFVGLAISIVATAAVSFIAERLTQG
ncbi:pilin [Candidatus Parcubacteria bacterium]|nr:pilin [Candidatus Parcubacteria bacterium]